MKLIYFLFLLCFAPFSQGLAETKIALLKYSGGGDWYANPTSLTRLIEFCNKNQAMQLEEDYAVVEAGSIDVYNYPFIHLTGHGNIVFSDREVKNLRKYLSAGGFLHIDDNYGMDVYVKREIKKIFPDKDFEILPLSHPLYNAVYDFSKTGLPKVHEHDNKTPQGYAIELDGRVVCFYTYECDLGDGWEDETVHGDSKETRTKALQMGCNIITYAFTH